MGWCVHVVVKDSEDWLDTYPICTEVASDASSVV